jgi:predicted metalloendopeptidase
MQNADPWKFDPLSGRGSAHKILVQRSRNRVACHHLLLSIDPHSPGKYRVDGVVQNMPEFQKAWSCKAGQPMVSANACRVW